MIDLTALFAQRLQRYVVALEGQPLPAPTTGIDYLWARNGVWKRGTTPDLSVMIQIAPALFQGPGLANLLPEVRWAAHPQRINGGLLAGILEHAQRAATVNRGVATPIEQMYLLTREPGRLRVRLPEQRATAASLSYATLPGETVLLDLHSHHGMRAFFSSTDDHDDRGLSVSAVIGNIFRDPTIIVRLNVYGHRQLVPAELVFTHLGPFLDGFQQGRTYANA